MSIQLIADMHTHTYASGHAYGTMLEMAKAASDIGLPILGISEHGPGIPGTCHPFHFINFEVVPRFLYGVEVYHGCEINMLENGELSLEEWYIDRLDYGIVGIHHPCYEAKDAKTNTDNLIKAIQHPKVFFVSHPDDSTIPLDYERLVPAAKEAHVALEVNNSSVRKADRRLNCLENIRTMLELCKQHGTYIILNTDSHFPTEVGQFDLALRMVEEVQFPEELIVNADADRLREFFGFVK